MRYSKLSHSFHLGALIGVMRKAREHVLSFEVTVMAIEELERVRGKITRVLADPRCKPGYGDRLRKAKREFETVSRSGRLDRNRLYRAVEIVAEVLVEILEDDADQRPK